MVAAVPKVTTVEFVNCPPSGLMATVGGAQEPNAVEHSEAIAATSEPENNSIATVARGRNVSAASPYPSLDRKRLCLERSWVSDKHARSITLKAERLANHTRPVSDSIPQPAVVHSNNVQRAPFPGPPAHNAVGGCALQTRPLSNESRDGDLRNRRIPCEHLCFEGGRVCDGNWPLVKHGVGRGQAAVRRQANYSVGRVRSERDGRRVSEKSSTRTNCNDRRRAFS